VLIDVYKDLVVAPSPSVAYTQATKSNILKLVREIEVYKREISFLRKQVANLNGDMTNLSELKACDFSIQDELNTMHRG
jgi:hypothetical protein